MVERTDLDVNKLTKYSMRDETSEESPLQVSCELGLVDVVDILIRREDLDCNLARGEEIPPLHTAARGGHEAIVRKLLSRSDIDDDAKTALDDWNALQYACDSGHVGVIQELIYLYNSTSVQELWAAPLLLACKHGQEEIVKPFEEYLVFNDEVLQAFLEVCEAGFLSLARMLVKVPHFDINATRGEMNGLHRACESGKLEIVQTLLSLPEIDINCTAGPSTALHIACSKNHPEIVEELLKHPCLDVNIVVGLGDKRTALHAACCAGSEEIVSLLLDTEMLAVEYKSTTTTPLDVAFKNLSLEKFYSLAHVFFSRSLDENHHLLKANICQADYILTNFKERIRQAPKSARK
mmetsp:Transcript_14524/g.18430  ORF Transcript_14524/g.18430 Transcript_14524/m.18430 type:complete len:351 (-) Transcript_14524:11-1063(-)